MAILSYSKKLVFIHPSKTGGTTVARYLQPDMKPGDLLLDNTFPAEEAPLVVHPQFGIWKHGYAKDFRTFLEMQNEDWDEYFTFATFRNPFERFTSAFQQVKRNPPQANGNPLIDEWLDGFFKAANDINLFIDTVALKEIEGVPLFLQPQMDYIVDDDRNVIVQHLILTEDIDTELQEFFGRRVVLRWNESEPSEDVLSDDSIRKLLDYYSEDFEMFYNLKEASSMVA